MSPKYLNDAKLAFIIVEFFAMIEYCSAQKGLSIRASDGAWRDASAIMARETGLPASRVHDDMTAYAAQHYGADWLTWFSAHAGKPENTRWNIRTLANVACEKVMRPDQHKHKQRG